YGQLVQDKAGRQLLEAQGNVGCTTWGVSLLVKEGVVSEVVELAQHCEVFSVRGTCLYVLGMLGKTRRGCDVLRKLGWDAVRHGRRTPWPVAPEEAELQQPQACDPNPLGQAPPTGTREPLSGSPART
ncbi:hypothetical protein CRUP_028369, partial [Coryphaenoides rupestris]